MAYNTLSFKEAIQAYLQAICMAPENSGYRYSLAYLYFEQKNFDKAQKEVDYILEHNPEYGLAHVLNALLKFEKNDLIFSKSFVNDKILINSIKFSELFWILNNFSAIKYAFL